MDRLPEAAAIHVAPIEQVAAEALASFVARRRPRASWLPPPVRDPFLRAFGERIFRSNYRPLLEPPWPSRRRGHVAATSYPVSFVPATNRRTQR